MTISPQEFREALRFFASGVTLVTSKSGETTHGMTVSAFSSISADPPIIAVAVHHGTTIDPLLQAPGASFAVSILAEDQEELSNRFAFETEEDRFLMGDWETATTGCPILRNALAWLDCSVIGRHVAGSHTIYLGSVEASGCPRGDGRPLLYWDREYRVLRIPSEKEHDRSQKDAE